MERKLWEKSDAEILGGVARSGRNGASEMADFILYLDEVKWRDLHLARGYSSIYNFLEKEHGYARNAAFLRTKAAQALRIEPTVEEAIRSRRIYATDLQYMMIAFSHEKKLRKGPDNPGLSPGEMKAALRDLIATRDVWRTIAVHFPDIQMDYRGARPHGSENTEYTLIATPDEVEKLNRAREVLSIPDFHDLVMKMVDITLKAKDPLAKPRKEPNTEPTDKQRGHVSVHIDRALHAEAESQCTFVCEETGRRCDARIFIQRDHLKPVAHGGTDSYNNFRLLCSAHNQYAARLVGLGFDENRETT